MSRDNSGTHSETRSSALWGTGNRGGDSRANALWGKGGRGFIAILTVLFVTAIPLAGGRQGPQAEASATTYVDPALLAKARDDAEALVRMIIQSSESESDAETPSAMRRGRTNRPDREFVKDRFKFVELDRSHAEGEEGARTGEAVRVSRSRVMPRVQAGCATDLEARLANR